MESERVGSGWWSRGARGRIDKRDGVVCVDHILYVGIVRSQGLRVVVVAAVSLLLLALGLLLFVQLALVLLVLCYAGLQGIG